MASDEEDYIEMELVTTSSSYSSLSASQNREFEFQMCSVSSNDNNKDSSPSPADELFYKGKLLPLHLPPRLQMVRKLLENKTDEPFQDIYGNATNNTNCSTPIESCRVSCELLQPDEYFFDWSTEVNAFISNNQNKCWSKKLKQIKQLSLTQKLKASRAYLKSLFSKSACNVHEECVSKGNYFLNKYTKVAKKNPCGQIENCSRFKKNFESVMGDEGCNSSTHRRSFSGIIQRHSANELSSTNSSASSSSSSFSFTSNAFYDLQLLKRSISLEGESSVEGAIAHCKKGCSLFATSIEPCRDQERSGICRI